MALQDRALGLSMLGETVHFRLPGESRRRDGMVVGYDPRPLRRPDGNYLIVRMEHEAWGWKLQPVPFEAVEELDPGAPFCGPVDVSSWMEG